MTSSPLLINEPPLQVLPSLAKIIGLNEAIVLQQVHYWLNPQFNSNFFEGRYWVHNTFAQWQKQFSFWSKKTIKRTISTLEDSGLLVSFVTRNFKKTKYYTVDYTLLNRISPSEVNALFLDKIVSVGTERKDGEEIAEKPGSRLLVQPGGQYVPLDGANLSPSPEPERENTPDSLENQGDFPWCQNIPFEEENLTLSMGSECPSREGQLVPLDGANLTPFHYTEITPENTAEIIILPPLPLSCPSSACERGDELQEEEEEEKEKEKNKNTKTKNAHPLTDDGMIEIWNETVQSKIHPGQAVYLTERRGTFLRTFRETVLRDRILIFPSGKKENGKTGEARSDPNEISELDAWQKYCDLIAKSRFLAGDNTSGFKVTLDWALIPEKAYKILEGAIYDKPKDKLPWGALGGVSRMLSSPQQPWDAFAIEIAQTLPPGACPEWIPISQHLAKKVGQLRYKAWFSKAYLKPIGNPDTSASDEGLTVATLCVENRFIKEYIDTNFRFDILKAIQTAYPAIKYLDFEVHSTPGGSK